MNYKCDDHQKSRPSSIRHGHARHARTCTCNRTRTLTRARTQIHKCTNTSKRDIPKVCATRRVQKIHDAPHGRKESTVEVVRAREIRHCTHMPTCTHTSHYLSEMQRCRQFSGIRMLRSEVTDNFDRFTSKGLTYLRDIARCEGVHAESLKLHARRRDRGEHAVPVGL